MARITARPRPISGIDNARIVDDNILASAVLNRGMITSVDPADIPNEALTLARNVRSRFDKTSRRFGRVLFSFDTPDASSIRKIAEHTVDISTQYIFRLTNSSVYYISETGTGDWEQVTGTLVGGDQDYMDFASVLGVPLFTNGTDRIQRINLETKTFADLSAVAPRAKFVTGFAERAVAAAADFIYWSANRIITQWDAAQDISAGAQQLDTSPNDDTDYVTGLYHAGNVLIIARQNSIWLASKQPVASNPLNFFNAVPAIGSDIPGANTLITNGIAFISAKHGTVFTYQPGNQPEDIGQLIQNELFASIEDASRIVMAYDSFNDEIIIGVPTLLSNTFISIDSLSGTIDALPGSINSLSGLGNILATTRLWIYNRRTKSWSYDEQDSITAIAYIDKLANYTAVDELIGTIDGLSGTMDSLSVVPITQPALFIGNTGGEIYVEDEERFNDGGRSFETEIRSKEYRISRDDILVTEIRVTYQATISGQLVLEYSKDGGTTWTTAKTITTTVGAMQILRYQRVIRTRRLMWRLTTSDGLLDVTEYEVHINAGGQSTE